MTGPWLPVIVVLFLALQAGIYESWAIRKAVREGKGGLTISEGVWNLLKLLIRQYAWALIMLGLVLGALYGHLFWCPCALR